MNFIAKLVGKCFRYFMLFALVLIGFESVNVFLQGQASFFELLATLAMLYLIYKFLVPLAERFLVANAAPQQRQAPRRRVGVVERFADSTGKAVSDWIMGSSAPVSSSGPDPRREANERAWRQYQAKDRAIFHEKQARTYAGTYDGGPMMAMWHPTGPSRPEMMPNDNDRLPGWAKK